MNLSTRNMFKFVFGNYHVAAHKLQSLFGELMFMLCTVRLRHTCASQFSCIALRTYLLRCLEQSFWHTKCSPCMCTGFGWSGSQAASASLLHNQSDVFSNGLKNILSAKFVHLLHCDAKETLSLDLRRMCRSPETPGCKGLVHFMDCSSA